MKIKRKVQKNLPQLIEWAWDNDDATGVRFQSDGFVTTVYFGKNGDVSVEDWSKDARFTVEVEEEITEDAEFNELVGLDVDGAYWQYDNVCVYDFNLDRIKGIYIPNDDLTMTLIWRDGKLVG